MSASLNVPGASSRNLQARLATIEAGLPDPLRAVLRGVGQVFFQENALSGISFLIGLAVSSPLMALGGLVGSALGYVTARAARFDSAETAGGIYGFNAALVAIATFFFFRPGPASFAFMITGCVLATVLTWLTRKHIPFPTYTTPFIVTTWAIFFLGRAMGVPAVEGYPVLVPDPPLSFTLQAISHGVGQVMFQGSLWTGLLFLLGVALGDLRHAALVLAGSIVGMLMAWHHTTEVTRAIDPERLVDRALFDNIALGLYGYNATLAPVALYLWRRSLIAPLLGMILAVPLAELVPHLGIPALTAPFVLATWIVLALGSAEHRLHAPAPPN